MSLNFTNFDTHPLPSNSRPSRPSSSQSSQLSLDLGSRQKKKDDDHDGHDHDHHDPYTSPFKSRSVENQQPNIPHTFMTKSKGMTLIQGFESNSTSVPEPPVTLNNISITPSPFSQSNLNSNFYTPSSHSGHGTRRKTGGNSPSLNRNLTEEWELEWTPEELSVMRQNGLAGKRVLIHEVKEKDTLSGVALYYGIKVNNFSMPYLPHLQSRV